MKTIRVIYIKKYHPPKWYPYMNSYFLLRSNRASYFLFNLKKKNTMISLNKNKLNKIRPYNG
jgi:hypothetical protein